jgi:hypothetical protein
VIARKARCDDQRILVWPAEDRWLVCGFMLCWMLICLDAVRLREQPDTWGIDHSLNNDITVLLRLLYRAVLELLLCSLTLMQSTNHASRWRQLICIAYADILEMSEERLLL